MSAPVSSLGFRRGGVAESLGNGRNRALPDLWNRFCGRPVYVIKSKQEQVLEVSRQSRGGRAIPALKPKQKQASGISRLRCCGGPIPALKPKQERTLGVPRFLRCGGPIPVIVGFTLIEILVVVVIVAVLALAVTISIATVGGERQLAREAERVQALIVHACIQAELTGREIGVRIGHSGYAFSLLGFDGWTASERKDELRARTWLPGMQVALYRDGREMRLAGDDSQPPQIVCFSSGELSPFVLSLNLGDVPKRYELRGHADGLIDIAPVDMQP